MMGEMRPVKQQQALDVPSFEGIQVGEYAFPRSSGYLVCDVVQPFACRSCVHA